MANQEYAVLKQTKQQLKELKVVNKELISAYNVLSEIWTDRRIDIDELFEVTKHLKKAISELQINVIPTFEDALGGSIFDE